jgi:hypothetical protein
MPRALPDLPQPGASNWAARVTEVIRTLTGRSGNGSSRAVTVADLRTGAVMVPGSSIEGGVGGADEEPDLTPPPTPSGLTATAGISTLIIECDEATYTVGHGHDRTIVYGATRLQLTDPARTFGDAVMLTQFQGAVHSLPVQPSTIYHLWIKWRSKDGVLSASPAGGTNGFQVTTTTDPALLIAALAGEISESELTTALGTRIDLIDAPSGVSGSVNARVLGEATARAAAVAAEAAARGTAISSEATLRQAGDDSLALQVSLITAGVAGGFDYGQVWYFDSGAEGWTSSGASQSTPTPGWVDVDSSGSDPGFVSPAISIAGGTYPVIKARIKRMAGTEASWDGTAYYTTSGHGFSASYCKTISVPAPFDVGDAAIVEFAMDTLTAGGSDWINNTITGIRLDFGADATDTISIDWVAVGRNAPGASVAGLLTEQQARISGDAAEAAARTTLAAQVATNTSAIATEQTARTTADTALAADVTVLQANVATNAAAISTEATARATADSALSSTISSVSAVANAKNKVFRQNTAPSSGMSTNDVWYDTDDGNKAYGYDGSSWVANDDARIAANAAAITTEATARANADSALATSISTVAATAASNTAAISAEQTARADGDTALASSIATVSAVASSKNKHFAQTTAPTSGMSLNDTWEDTDDGNKQYRYDGTSWVAADDARIAQNVAAISTETSARATADSALASALTTLSASVGGNTAAIATEASVRASETGHLGALWTMRMSVGNIVGGIGVAGTSGGTAGSTIDLAFRVNKFYITPPEGVSDTPAATFYYQSTSTTVNGVTRPAGLYVSDAFIGNGVIGNAQIGNLAVDNAKISSMSVDKLLAGSLAVGQYVRSTSYVPATSGWAINSDGTAEFNNVTVRGSVYASAGFIGGIAIAADSISSSNWNGSTGPSGAGFRIASDGSASFNSMSLRGQLNAGSFSTYAWPAPGGTGVHLSGAGLMIGNFNDGHWFNVDPYGNLSMPGFEVTWGAATFTGTIQSANYVQGVSGYKISPTTLYTSYGIPIQAEFNGVALSRPLVVASGVFVPAADNQFTYTPPEGESLGGWSPANNIVMRTLVDTLFGDAEAVSNIKRAGFSAKATCTSSYFTYSGAAPPGATKLYDVPIAVKIISSVDHFPTGSGGAPGGRILLQFEAFLPRNVYSSGGTQPLGVRIDAITWSLSRVT